MQSAERRKHLEPHLFGLLAWVGERNDRPTRTQRDDTLMRHQRSDDDAEMGGAV